jgi:hypothetical protein
VQQARNLHTNAGGEDPLVVTQFYYSQTLPYLMMKHRAEIRRRHDQKKDNTTVILVRRVAELAYAKHGALDKTDDLGPITRTRLQTFLDGAWYEAMAHVYKGKLKAKKAYQVLRHTQQIVMTE